MSIPRSWMMRYGVAVLAVLVAFVIKLLLDPLIQQGSSFLLFSLAVLVGAVFGGLGPGILATVIAAVAGDYFFVEPVGTLVPPGLDHGLRTGIFVLQGFAISGIGAALMFARRRSETALEASRKAEESYRGIFENAVDGIFRTAEDGRILAANPALGRMLGYDSPEEVIAGGAMVESFYANISEREKLLYLMRENGVVRNFEVRLRHREGGEVWASVNARAVRDGDGTAFEGIIEDVTGRKRVEDALRLRDRAVSESANGIVITDANQTDNPIVHVNPAFERMTGYSAEEVLGRNCRFLQGADRYQPPLDELREAIREELSSKVVLRNYKKDGTPFWNELSVSPVRDEAGEVTHFIGVQEDVTLRRRAEEELRRSEDRLRQATDVAALGTWDYNLVSGDFVWDERSREFHGLPPNVGVDYEKFLSRLHADDRERVNEAIQRALDPEGDGEYRIEYRTTAPAGGSSRWIDARGQTFFEEDGQPTRMVGTVQDITERKRAEEVHTRLAAIVESSEDAIIAKTPDGTITDWNRGAQRLYGYSAEEAVGSSISILTPPELSGEIPRILESIRRGESVEKETVRVSKDGRRLNISLRVSPIKDARGNVTGASTIARDITEQKRAEEVLRESEERFRATFEQAAVGVAHVGPDGSWLRVNGRLCEIVGYAREELLEKTFQDITHPEDLDADLEHLRRLLTGEIGRYSVEKRYFRKDGSIVWINLTVSLVRDAEGEPDYFVSVIEDITERKEAETRYQTLVEQLPAVTYIQDAASSTLAYLSPQFEEMTGYSVKEYLAAPELRARSTHPDDYEWVLAEDRRTEETGEDFLVEYRRVRRDGEVIWVHEQAVLVKDPEGRPLYWQGILTDMTERREAEEALRQSEDLYRSVIEQAAEGIFLADARDLRILEVNAALAESLGYTEEELERMTIYDISPHDRESVDHNVRLTLENGRHYIGERKYRRKDGSLVDVEVSLSVISRNGHETLCVVAHDVSELRRAERSLREIKEAEQARIAQDLHDTVLQDMAFAVQEINVRQIIAESRDEEDPQLEEIADILRRGIENLRSAVFEMRLQGETERTFMGSLEALVDLNRRMARHRYTIGVTVDHGFPERLSEMARVEMTRVIQEALSNVRKHAAPSHVHISLIVDGDDLLVEVSDDGGGFDKKDSSTGLGSSSMHRRAERIGGRLEVESSPGEGTKVRLRVPAGRCVPEGARA